MRERAATLTSGTVVTGELDEVWTSVFRVVSGCVGVSLVRYVMLYRSSSGKGGRERGRNGGMVVILIYIFLPVGRWKTDSDRPDKTTSI